MELTVEGHAGYAEPGKDLVCAAVSILVYTLDQNLEDMGLGDPKNLLEEGKARIACKEQSEETTRIYNTIWSGLRILEENYPEYVKCSEVG